MRECLIRKKFFGFRSPELDGYNMGIVTLVISIGSHLSEGEKINIRC